MVSAKSDDRTIKDSMAFNRVFIFALLGLLLIVAPGVVRAATAKKSSAKKRVAPTRIAPARTRFTTAAKKIASIEKGFFDFGPCARFTFSSTQ